MKHQQKYQQKNYKCKNCGTVKRAWIALPKMHCLIGENPMIQICHTLGDACEMDCDGCLFNQEHDPKECGCTYLGNDMWSCGHMDNDVLVIHE